jgi:hypothetical protein
VTPVLSAVYEELIQRANAQPHAGLSRVLVRRFLERTGKLPPDHPQASFRHAAAWEDAMCSGGLARQIAPDLDDPVERNLTLLLERAHRGIFRFDTLGARHVVHELWSGAWFILVARDDIGRAVSGDNLGSLCQGRVVGAPDGCAFLPGAIFHDAAATGCIESVLQAARKESIDDNTLFDALLRMDHALRTMSRVRPGWAYRVEVLRGVRSEE